MPRLLALAIILAATPPASSAERLASARKWDELYLAFAAAPPKEYTEADRKKVAVALARGCVALEADDAVIAFSLGTKAAEFLPTADALVCVGRAGSRSEQKSAAEAVLKAGRSAFPTDARFPLELGRLALLENDAAGAVSALSSVPKKAPQAREAASLLKQARSLQAEGKDAKRELVAMERALHREPRKGSREGPLGPEALPRGQAPAPASDNQSWESSVDDEGRRLRANTRFRFRYFGGQRDFGQRAEYEGRVQGALEEARQASVRLLGLSRESPTEVILYSKEEFTLHHGAQAAQMILGFYSQNAIRMNDSAEINPHNQATLVHEYVHAVVDEVSGFHDGRVPTWLNEGLAEWTQWQYEGTDEGPGFVRKGLQQATQAKRLPGLDEMSRGMLAQQDNPGLRYAFSAVAVGVLLKRGGPDNFLGMIREVGAGQPFTSVLKNRYERDLAQLQEEVEAEVKER